MKRKEKNQYCVETCVCVSVFIELLCIFATPSLEEDFISFFCFHPCTRESLCMLLCLPGVIELALLVLVPGRTSYGTQNI